MWRAQFFAALIVAAVSGSGRASGQPSTSAGGGGGGGGGGNGAGTGSTSGRLPASEFAASWMDVRGASGARPMDVVTLLQLKGAVENWPEFYAANNFTGWDSTLPPCSWSGVTCADDGTILTLSWQCRACDVRAVGTLPPGLGAISTLATLDLQSNRFYGTLPPSWGDVDTWAQLQNMYLNDNNFTGTLPEKWGEAGSMPSLLQLRLDNNRLTGTLPQNWGSQETSMRELGVIRLSNNSFTGGMPEQWGTPGAFPQLAVLSLDSNRINGTLPTIWGAPQAMVFLQELHVHNNSLTGGLPPSWGSNQGMMRLRFLFASDNPLGGTLPPEWGQNGSFPELKTLDLNATQMWGTLPPEWGSPGALATMESMRIERNDLSGTVPLAWAGMENLARLVILPGNPRLCGLPPPDLPFALCDDRDLTCLRLPAELNSTCGPILAPPRQAPAPAATAGNGSAGGVTAGSVPAPAAAPRGPPGSSSETPGSTSAGDDGSSGGARTGAIVGGAVGGAVGAALLAGLLALVLGRRRRRRREDEQHKEDELITQEDAKPSSRPFISEEEEMEHGLSGGPSGRVHSAPHMSPFAAVPIRNPSASFSSRTTLPVQNASSRSLPATPERKPSRLESLLAGSGLLPSGSSSIFTKWCSDGRTASLELQARDAELGTPRAGASMEQITEEAEGSTHSKKHSAEAEEAAMAAAVAAEVLPPSSPTSPLGTAPASANGTGSGSLARAKSEGYTLPWIDWEILPEELDICKRPDGSDWLLGSGGFGKVYKALKHGVQPVAVKIIPNRGDPHTPGTVQEAKQEIAILRACRDVNIVQFVGAFLGPDLTMLVTEYLEGGDLMRNIAAHRVSWYRRGKKIALDVARGLVFLHSRRVVHFDLKSPNVLLSKDGTAKIADVGMAKVMQRDYITGVVSTLAWSAPEMLWGAKCTEKADIYSYGIVLWEICSGEAPERGRLRDLRVPQECPAEVRQLILECLESRPSLRPSALQIAERLAGASATPPPEVALPRSSMEGQAAADAAAAGAAGEAGEVAQQDQQRQQGQQEMWLGQAEQQAEQQAASAAQPQRGDQPPSEPQRADQQAQQAQHANQAQALQQGPSAGASPEELQEPPTPHSESWHAQAVRT